MGYRLQTLFLKARQGLSVLSCIQLGANQQNGSLGVVMIDLGEPLEVRENRERAPHKYLRSNILVGLRTRNREANDEDIRARIAERPQGVILLRA